MNVSRTPLFLALALLSGTVASATIITEPTRTFTVGTDIPDFQDPPLSFLQTISDSSIFSLTQVQISLNLVGTPASSGFAGEMVVLLNKNLSLTSVLLNRAGFSGTDSVGQPYDGWNVTFSDLAASDVHLATLDSGVLTGTYQPDGRVNPIDTLRPELLDVFNGETGNGDWRISVGDLEAGGTMRLASWSLTLTGEAVPEPGTWAAIVAMAGLTGVTWWRRNARGTPATPCDSVAISKMRH